MKKALALIILGLLGLSSGRSAAPAGSSVEPSNNRYLAKPELLPAVEARIAAFKGKPCDLIFIGDSITANWVTIGKPVWDRCYADRRALDFGSGGDKTQHVLWRLDHLDLSGIHPKVAVILIGTNNLDDEPSEIAAGVKAVIADTQRHFPGIKIVSVSIMPNQRANAKMMAANALIRNLADGDRVRYLDLIPLMPPIGDNFKGIDKRGLHPSVAGYEIWAAALEPMLQSLLGPKPASR